MKKIAAAASLALIAGAAGASVVQTRTGSVDLYSDDYAYPTTSASFESLVEQAVAGSPVITLPAFDNYQVDMNSKAFDATITFAVTVGGTWDFRAGVDFGAGGTLVLDAGTPGAIVIATSTNDMWWGGDWSNSDGILQGSIANLSLGTHTLNLFGIEYCCSGYQTVQYRTGNGTFNSFGADDGLVSTVPEAQSVAMLLAGLGLVGTLVRRRRQA